MTQSIGRNLAAVTFICLGILFAGVPVAFWIGSSVILFPKRRAFEERHVAVRNAPEDYGITLEAFEAKTHDEHFLKGFVVHLSKQPEQGQRTSRMLGRMKRAGVTRRQEPRGTVILLHGRGGLKENMLTVAQRFVAADFRCIVYDARAHGESGGRVCTFGIHERKDVSAVLDHVEEIIEPRGETLGPVLAFGLSLGAAVVLQTLPEEPRIKGATAVAPFADFREQIHYSISKATQGKVPEPVKAGILQLACFRGGFEAGDIRPVDSATRINVPVFIAHGRKDRVIPIDHAERIFEALPDARKNRWKEVLEGYHFNVLAEGGDDLYEEMIHFFIECAEPS